MKTRVATRDLFSGLKSEDEQEFRTPEIKKNSTLAYIMNDFENVNPVDYDALFGGLSRIGAADRSFNSYLYRMNRISEELTSRDIEQFSIVLNKYHNKKTFGANAGIYLSALISLCDEPEFTVHTNHLERLMYLGFKNKGKHLNVRGFGGDYLGTWIRSGKITVCGDVGDYVGSSMRGGRISVQGNAGDDSGWVMKKGLISISGNVANYTGTFMDGGHISIEGNAGKCTGGYMNGGQITVNGDVIGGPRDTSLGIEMEGGKIHVSGNVAGAVGREMGGGEIHIHGRPFRLSKAIKGGSIFHKDKIRVKDGEVVRR